MSINSLCSATLTRAPCEACATAARKTFQMKELLKSGPADVDGSWLISIHAKLLTSRSNLAHTRPQVPSRYHGSAGSQG